MRFRARLIFVPWHAVPLVTRHDPPLACEEPSRRTVPFLGMPSKPRTITLNSDVKGRHVGCVKILVSCFTRACLARHRVRDMRDNTNAWAKRAACSWSTCARRASASRMLALVHVRLASQVACTRKRKCIRRAPLDGVALATFDAMTCAVVVAFSARHTHTRSSQVPSRRTPINGVARARCSSRRLPSLGYAHQRTGGFSTQRSVRGVEIVSRASGTQNVRVPVTGFVRVTSTRAKNSRHTSCLHVVTRGAI